MQRARVQYTTDNLMSTSTRWHDMLSTRYVSSTGTILYKTSKIESDPRRAKVLSVSVFCACQLVQHNTHQNKVGVPLRHSHLLYLSHGPRNKPHTLRRRYPCLLYTDIVAAAGIILSSWVRVAAVLCDIFRVPPLPFSARPP